MCLNLWGHNDTKKQKQEQNQNNFHWSLVIINSLFWKVLNKGNKVTFFSWLSYRYSISGKPNSDEGKVSLYRSVPANKWRWNNSISLFCIPQWNNGSRQWLSITSHHTNRGKETEWASERGTIITWEVVLPIESESD